VAIDRSVVWSRQMTHVFLTTKCREASSDVKVSRILPEYIRIY